MYNAPIPIHVQSQIFPLAYWAVGKFQPTEISASSFPSDDGNETLFGLDVSFNPRVVKVKDRRRDDFLIVERTSFYLRADGTQVEGSPSHDRWHRVGSISGNPGHPTVTEDDYETEQQAARNERMAREMGS